MTFRTAAAFYFHCTHCVPGSSIESFVCIRRALSGASDVSYLSLRQCPRLAGRKYTLGSLIELSLPFFYFQVVWEFLLPCWLVNGLSGNPFLSPVCRGSDVASWRIWRLQHYHDKNKYPVVSALIQSNQRHCFCEYVWFIIRSVVHLIRLTPTCYCITARKKKKKDDCRVLHDLGLLPCHWVCGTGSYSSPAPASLHTSPFASQLASLSSRRKQIERETFVICMQREHWGSLPNMRAIQSDLAMIRRNVSNLPSCVMDGILPWWRPERAREAEKPVWVGWNAHLWFSFLFWGGVRPTRVAACVHAYRCLLCGHTARLPPVFVFLLQQSDTLIWKGSSGIIDSGARCGHVKCKLNSACLPDRNGYLQSLQHILGVINVRELTFLGFSEECKSVGSQAQATVKVAHFSFRILLSWLQLYGIFSATRLEIWLSRRFSTLVISYFVHEEIPGEDIWGCSEDFFKYKSTKGKSWHPFKKGLDSIPTMEAEYIQTLTVEVGLTGGPAAQEG